MKYRDPRKYASGFGLLEVIIMLAISTFCIHTLFTYVLRFNHYTCEHKQKLYHAIHVSSVIELIARDIAASLASTYADGIYTLICKDKIIKLQYKNKKILRAEGDFSVMKKWHSIAHDVTDFSITALSGSISYATVLLKTSLKSYVRIVRVSYADVVH
ncbi:hypothetical protein KG892_00725 [Vermiphilus pyriformis]|nr:MAG: hypothetical protein KG892_00725 [Vermiphilus pyriformis]